MQLLTMETDGMQRLAGKTAVVTGGGSGMEVDWGGETVVGCARDGEIQ